MSQNRNRLLIERFYHELWNRFDKTIFPDILAEDLRFRGSLGQTKRGLAEFGDYVDFIQRAFPDFSNEIEEIISEGDKRSLSSLIAALIAVRFLGSRPRGDTFSTQARPSFNSGAI
jgi:predicted ester cyclase